jgi:hypothetical protein
MTAKLLECGTQFRFGWEWKASLRAALQNAGARIECPAAYFKSYCTCTRPGGFHVPSPGGRIDGGVAFGQ